MVQSKGRCCVFEVERLEDRTVPALFGPIDTAVTLPNFGQPSALAVGDVNAVFG